MELYLVGGYVRDKVMGKEPKDRDFVVVGSSREEMLSLHFSEVGADFPVFLHPETGEEYALARIERKTGKGYHGFACEFGSDVTLEEDLYRRDFTMNAMAMTLDETKIIDPFNGQQDLKDKVIRHVSEAFREDPLRVIRALRFALRYDFAIHEDTQKMMKEVGESQELNEVTAERLLLEIQKILKDDKDVNKGVKYFDQIVGLENYPLLKNYQSIFDYALLQGKENREFLFLVSCKEAFSAQKEKEMKLSSEVMKAGKAFWSNAETILKYEQMNPEGKIELIKKLKLRNNNDQEYKQNMCDLMNLWYKHNGKESFVDVLMNDVAIIDNLDYDAISENAPSKKDIPEYILKAQVDALSNVKKSKPKLGF